jgi:arabinofuranosyltransferase
MSGRFFTLPLLAAAVLLSRLDYEKIGSEAVVLLFAVVAGLGLMSPIPTYQLYGPENYAVVDGRGIADERVWYFPDVALIHSSRMKVMPDSVGKYWGIEARELGKQDMQVNPSGNIGLYGYYAGPQVHIIDWFALADALEARLPAKRMVNWRIGHFERVVPKGYVSTAYAPGNRIEDQKLAKFYDQLELIVKGELFSRERWQAIWLMNTHQLDYLIDFETYRYPDTVERSAAQLAPDAGKKAEAISMSDSGMVITLPEVSHATQLEISLDSDDEYQVIYYQDKTVLAEQMVNAPFTPDGLAQRRLTVPLKAAQSGYDRLRVLPVRGDDSYHLGSFKLVE